MIEKIVVILILVVLILITLDGVFKGKGGKANG